MSSTLQRIISHVLQVSRSGYYRWREAREARARRLAADRALAEEIRRIHAGQDGTYGSPRVTAELRDAGRKVNHKRIERVMRSFGIVGLHLRKKVRTTVPEPSHQKVPDLIKRNFTAAEPNRRYVGDITYLPVGDGRFLYLATVIDLFSRRLAGWSIADHMRTELVIDALETAARTRGGRLDGAIFHSDHGAQYTSADFAAACARLGVVQSMGCGGYERRQLARRGVQRQPETRDPARPQTLVWAPRGTAGGVPMGHPLQHHPQALGPRPNKPDQLRITVL
ncbi:MAG: transposase TnpB [Actinomycetia bacterium]|nr:transposase TnpB [Actinomycetes bacterium]